MTLVNNLEQELQNETPFWSDKQKDMVADYIPTVTSSSVSTQMSKNWDFHHDSHLLTIHIYFTKILPPIARDLNYGAAVAK